MNRVSAILPAAGLGTRMGAETPKQFRSLDGVPLLIFTLRRLAECPAITDFVISTRAEEVESVAASLESEKSWPPGSSDSRRRYPPGLRGQRAWPWFPRRRT